MVFIQGGTNAGDAHSVCAEQLHQHRPVHWIDPRALLEKSRSFCRTSWLYPRCPINGSGNVFCPAWRDRSDDFGNRSRCSSCSGPPRGNGNGDFNCGVCNWHFYTWDWDSRMAGVPLSGCSDRSRCQKTVRAVTDLGRQIRHLEFGGHYTDTETAQRLRMQAFYEMSGATSAARRYLGQEAYFLHR